MGIEINISRVFCYEITQARFVRATAVEGLKAHFEQKKEIAPRASIPEPCSRQRLSAMFSRPASAVIAQIILPESLLDVFLFFLTCFRSFGVKSAFFLFSLLPFCSLLITFTPMIDWYDACSIQPPPFPRVEYQPFLRDLSNVFLNVNLIDQAFLSNHRNDAATLDHLPYIAIKPSIVKLYLWQMSYPLEI